MLTGMEAFLSQLTVAILKKHCDELKLGKSKEKKELVDK